MDVLDYEGIRLSLDEGLAIIELNATEMMNALTVSSAESFFSALQEISKPRHGIRALMLRGVGNSFCAGVNLWGKKDNSAREKGRNLDALPAIDSHFHTLVRRLYSLDIPVLAAVNGPCVGIGLSMALMSNYIIAREDAYFLVPFRNIASAPDSGLSWLLPRAIGSVRASQMIMRGERCNAQTALSWGLVNEVVREAVFEARTLEMAREFAQGPTIALGLMRKLLQESGPASLDQQMEAETRAVRITSRSKDNLAAVRSFLTKDPFVFTGE